MQHRLFVQIVRAASTVFRSSAKCPWHSSVVTLGLFIVLIGTSGCSALLDGHPRPAVDPDFELNTIVDKITADKIVACLEAPDVSCRNRIVGGRMFAADLRFAEFEERLFKEGREVQFGGSLAALGLSAAATASTGGTARVFSALTTLLLGARESYQKDLLAERTAIAIHTSMRAKRAQVALRLRVGLRQSQNDYPVGVALADLNEYVHAGSVLGALIGITETVGDEARKGQEALHNDVMSFDFRLRDDSATEIERLLCGGKAPCRPEQLDKTVLKKIDECIKKEKLRPKQGAAFALSTGAPDYSAEDRRKVVACLKEP
jgi:hypothetical protein